MEYKISNDKNSSVEIEVTIKNAEFLAYWNEAFKSIQKEVELDGFRKGMAPESAIIAKYGEMAILQEMGSIAINKTYVDVVVKEKLHILSEPNIHIVKLSKADDFVYHAHVTVYPKITMPDYKAIAKNVIEEVKPADTEVTDEEVQKVLEQISDEIKNETPDLESKIKENYKMEKEMINKSNQRSKFLEKIISEIDALNPDMWPKEFQDKDKAQVAAVEVAKAEKLTASAEEIDAEVVKLMMHIPKEDIISGKVDEERVRAYASQMVINEKVFIAIGL